MVEVGMYYDRDGRSIELEEFGRLHKIREYRRIAETDLPNVWVSTVWLGIDHGFRGGAPVIFETMVFRHTDQDRLDELVNGHAWLGNELDCRRYTTAEAARVGHAAAVEKWRDWDGVDTQAD